MRVDTSEVVVFEMPSGCEIRLHNAAPIDIEYLQNAENYAALCAEKNGIIQRMLVRIQELEQLLKER